MTTCLGLLRLVRRNFAKFGKVRARQDCHEAASKDSCLVSDLRLLKKEAGNAKKNETRITGRTCFVVGYSTFCSPFHPTFYTMAMPLKLFSGPLRHLSHLVPCRRRAVLYGPAPSASGDSGRAGWTCRKWTAAGPRPRETRKWRSKRSAPVRRAACAGRRGDFDTSVLVKDLLLLPRINWWGAAWLPDMYMYCVFSCFRSICLIAVFSPASRRTRQDKVIWLQAASTSETSRLSYTCYTPSVSSCTSVAQLPAKTKTKNTKSTNNRHESVGSAGS